MPPSKTLTCPVCGRVVAKAEWYRVTCSVKCKGEMQTRQCAEGDARVGQ
jgi:predicted nucleic acid-binding Zn ribbon protein